LTLDLGHGQLLTTENTSHGLIKNYPERIRHIHLHDNRGGNSPQDDLHLPVGQGTIRFSRIMIALKQMGYERTMTLELRPKEIGACLGYVRHLLGDC
jgi:sugar phosphate isomerase/epimerase